MSIPAYVYARFSTAEQHKGHSLKRQLEGGRKHVEENGWLYDEQRNIVDEGRSAFSGANRDEGAALYEFEQKARAGHFLNGAILVCENLDRLSRQGYEETFDLVRLFTKNGVTVATWFDGHQFKAGERIDFMDFLKLSVAAERALDESAAKSKRMKAAWKKKYDDADTGDRRAMTRILPGWLEADPDTKAIRPIPHRVEVLNWIFDQYIEGKGLPWIERQLNTRGEPNWGMGKKAGKPWNVGSLHKYLTSRGTLGEFTPKTRKGHGPRNQRGGTIPDYYPQVISTEKFNRAQAVRASRKGWGGKNQFSLPNLFTGIARCGECGGPIIAATFSKAGSTRSQLRRSGNGRRTYTDTKDRGYLKCQNASRKLGCTNKTYYPYYPLEGAVLRYLWDFAMRGEFIQPNSKAAQLTEAVAERERQIALKRAQMDGLLTNLMEVRSKALAQKLADMEVEVEQDDEQLAELRKELQIELGKAPPKQDLEALTEARSALQSSDEEVRYAARAKTHQALKRLINVMDCQPNGDAMIVFGSNSAGITFDRDGNCTDLSALNARYEGPDGEPDWHPDREAVE